MSREEIIAAIRECAAELKRNPSLADLHRMKGITWGAIRHRLGRLADALRAAGLEPKGIGYRPTAEALLMDWARVAREQGDLPSLSVYGQQGRYSTSHFFPISAVGRECPAPSAALSARKAVNRNGKTCSP